MKKGDYISTPRFCTVRIEEVFENEIAANDAGYTEPTYYCQGGYKILGKSIDMYHMQFAAVKMR